MPPEKLTGKGSDIEWADHDERDAVFENMRQKAIGLIDDIDLISIAANQQLLDLNTTYDFNDSNAQLSSIVVDVIKGLFKDPEARDYLFPAWIETDEDLAEFINNRDKRTDDTARNFINFIYLAVRSGIAELMSIKRVLREHISTQADSFLKKFFRQCENALSFPDDKLSASQLRLKSVLLEFVDDEDHLDTEIIKQFDRDPSMDVFCYYLRTLKVANAGTEARIILLEVVEDKYVRQRKKIVDLVEKKRSASTDKLQRERQSTNLGMAAVTNPRIRLAAHMSTEPQTTRTIRGAEIPVPSKITGPENATDDDSGSDFSNTETTGEVTLVDADKIPAFSEPKKSTRSITEYSEKPHEITDPEDKLTRVVPEPIKIEPLPEPAVSELNKGKTNVIAPVSGIAPMAPTSGQHDVLPPISGVAFTAKPVKKIRVEVDGDNITVPVLPSLTDELEEKAALKWFQERVRHIHTKGNVDLSYMDAAIDARSEFPEAWARAKIYIEAQKALEKNKKEQPKWAFGKWSDKLRRYTHWMADNPKKVAIGIAFIALAITGGIAYYVTREDEEKSKKEKNRIAAKSTTNDRSKQIIKDLPKDKKEPIMAAPMQASMHMEPAMAAMKPVMKAPVEVMKASRDLVRKRPVQKPGPKTRPVQKVVDVKGAQSNPRFANIDVKTTDDLPDGRYKQMWEGKKFKLKGKVSYSKFLEDAFKKMMKKLPRRERYKAKYAFYKERKKLEKGWLIYNKLKEEKLVAKALTKEGLTEKEAAQLKDWNDYQDSHRGRARQARREFRRYKRAMKSKKKGKNYKKYKDLLARGVELMEFPSLTGLERSADNILPHEEISYATKDGKVLKTMMRFARAIKKKARSFPMPDLIMGKKRGSIDQTPTHVMFAETLRLTEDDIEEIKTPPIPEDDEKTRIHKVEDSQIVSAERELKPILGAMLAKKPPRIPKDARVHQIRREDIIEEKMQKPKDFGSKPLGEFKPVLAKIMADRKRPPEVPEDALPKIKDEDIVEVRNVTPPPIPVEDSQIRSVKDMAPVPPMYGSAPLPDDSILRPKPPAIPADAKPSVYDIPRVEGAKVPPYVAMTDDRMPKVGPPPIPAMADVPKEAPKKKSIWSRAKKWLVG